MRRIEMVALLEHLKLEIWEDPAESGGDRAVLVWVAQRAEREVDGAIEPGQRVTVKFVRLKRLQERPDPAGTLRHPGRRITRRWWRQLNSRLDAESHERTHEL